MASLALRITVAVGMLAFLLHYLGVVPPIPGLGFITPRLSGSSSSGGVGTVNVQKLLADLNSDLPCVQSGDGCDADAVDRWQVQQRAASAALSVMYLAAVPALREQATRVPSVVESLLRHVMTLDVAAAEVEHRRQQQQHYHQQQHQQQQQQVEVAGPELLPASVLAVAKLASGDEALAGALLGAARGTPSGVRALEAGQLLERLDSILQSGVPSWQAAAAVLLHSLAGEQLMQPGVLAWVNERADNLIDVGMGLVETGASYNSSDAVQAGTQLLELVAAQPRGRRKLSDSGAPAVMYQVVVSYAGLNASSNVVGGAVRVLRQLNGVQGAGGRATVAGSRRSSRSSPSPSGVMAAGLVAPLVREVRLGQRPSLGPSLALLADMVRADDPADSVGREAVGAGLLSLCAQLLFKAGSAKEAREHCSPIVKHTVVKRRSRQPEPVPKQEGAAAFVDELEDPEAEVEMELAEAEAEQAVNEDEPYHDTPDGRAELGTDLMRILRETEYPDLHNAVLEACRDVTPARLAAEALVGAGVVPHLVAILAYNTTQGFELGLDGTDTAWVLQSQRSAAATIALLALQSKLRPQVVSDGALIGLGLALKTHSGMPGLMSQVRITAAAALVPLIGEDGRYNQAAVTAGVLEPMVKMFYSRNEQERQIAGRVLRLLGSSTSVAAMYDRAGIKV